MKVNNKEQMNKISGQASVFMKIDKGETKVRIMSDIHAVKEHDVHVQGKFHSIACPTENMRMRIANGDYQATEVPPCPLCELGYPVKTNYLAYAVQREQERNGKIYGGEAWVLKKGQSVLGKIQSFFDDSDWGDSTKYDIKIIATGDMKQRRYEVMAIPADKSPELTVKENISLEDLKQKADLDEMTTPRSYKEIREIIGELADYEQAKESEARKQQETPDAIPFES